MRRSRTLSIVALFAIVVVPARAVALGDCGAELAAIDRRIAAGKYPDMNVGVARQMRTSMEQMCGMLDDATRAQMIIGIEEVLPTRTEAEKRADREAKRAAAKAAVRQPKNGSIEAPIADDQGVWLFGNGYPTDEFSRFRFWSERIERK